MGTTAIQLGDRVLDKPKGMSVEQWNYALAKAHYDTQYGFYAGKLKEMRRVGDPVEDGREQSHGAYKRRGVGFLVRSRGYSRLLAFLGDLAK